MKPLPKFALLLAAFVTPPIAPAIAQSDVEEFYRQWIDYRNGEISVAFEETPLRFALHAFHARTGFQIIVPTTIERKVVSLRIDRQPLEPAVRSLISNIGFRNFAVMYDDNGRPRQAVVIGAQPVVTAAPGQNAELAAAPITLEERDQIKKRFGSLDRSQTGRSRPDRRPLKTLPSSEDREILVKEYGRQLLGISK